MLLIQRGARGRIAPTQQPIAAEQRVAINPSSHCQPEDPAVIPWPPGCPLVSLSRRGVAQKALPASSGSPPPQDACLRCRPCCQPAGRGRLRKPFIPTDGMSFPTVRAAKGIKATPFMKFMFWAAGSKLFTTKRGSCPPGRPPPQPAPGACQSPHPAHPVLQASWSCIPPSSACGSRCWRLTRSGVTCA